MLERRRVVEVEATELGISSANLRFCIYTNVGIGSQAAVGWPRMDFIASMAGDGHNLPIKSSGLSDWLKLKAVIQRPFGDRQAPTRWRRSAQNLERAVSSRLVDVATGSSAGRA